MRVEVVEPDASWTRQFEEEARLLRSIFGGEIIHVHHIGSTAVPGLKAKPVIDILPVVRDIARVDAFNAQMEGIGYHAMGEFGLVGRRYFRKGGDNRTHQVHAYDERSHEAIARHIAFRDYLRAHPEVAHEYGELKAALALQHPNDIESYMDGKDAFVLHIERRALLWAGLGVGVE